MIEADGIVRFPDSLGVFRITPGSSSTVRFSVAGEPRKVAFFEGEMGLPLAFNTTTRVWESVIAAPRELSTFRIRAVDDAGNALDRDLVVLAPVAKNLTEENSTGFQGVVHAIRAIFKF